METTIYNQEGKQAGSITLPERIFDAPWNADLVHQVVISMQANARPNVAHTKTRGEVSGGGKKPWKQKGTGRARHGSIRSPLWRGGGTTFGPRSEKDYTKKINRKMRSKALFSVLSRKLRDQELFFVDSLTFNEPKTAQATVVLEALAKPLGLDRWGVKKRNTILFALVNRDENVMRSFRNIGNVAVEELRNVNAWDLLQYKYVILISPDDALELLSQKAQQGALA